jgi:ATP-dependent RNA circularization protein (DNA/RNA ligase family)
MGAPRRQRIRPQRWIETRKEMLVSRVVRLAFQIIEEKLEEEMKSRAPPENKGLGS